MVVILIVNAPSVDSPFHPVSHRGEQLSTTNTNTTSISFVSSSSSSQVDPDNSLATTKEEEWVTKKKVELTTKRQIETRVKRQVVLEDGKVVEDSGPIVTTNTTEDTEKQESSQTEHRHLGDDEPDGDGWVAVPGQGGVVKEVKERTVKSREEKEERLETEDVQHLGDISDDAYLSAIQRQSKEGGDLRLALERTRGHELQRLPEGRIVHQSTRTKKVVDTDDSRHLSELQPDGRVVTESKRTTEHEEVNNTEEPDDGRGSGGEEEESHKQGSQHYTKTKDQEFVEYLADGKKIGEEMRYEAENVEGDRQGDTSLLDHEWDSLSTRIKKIRRSRLQQAPGAAAGAVPGAGAAAGVTPLDRKDALTKKPLDFDQEEETRKVETSKWLEHHFGSESRSSKDSIGDDDELPATGKSTSFINVTMTSTKNKVNGINGLDPQTKYHNSSSRVFVSSPERENGSPTSYFQGISEWRTSGKEYHPERPSRTSFNSPTGFKDRVQVLPTGPNHTFTPSKSSPSPPYPSSSLGSKNIRGSQGSNLNGRASSGPDSSSPFQSLTERHVQGHGYQRHYRHEQPSPSPSPSPSPQHHPQPQPLSPQPYPGQPYINRQYNGHVNGQREEERERFVELDEERATSRLLQRERELHQPRLEEPAPDYPPPSPTPSPTPPPEAKKKVYQRTRFAADIPPPTRTKTAQSTQTPHKSSLGESFRKFVGKFRSASKEKRRNKKGSRSPSPASYQQYHPVDSHIAGGGGSDGEGEGPVAPPRVGRAHAHTVERGKAMRRNGDTSTVVHKYYLGEDPFGGSIYGREKEYDGVTPFRRKSRRGSETLEEERNLRNQQMNGNGSSTLGRFSKSTSRLISDRVNNHVINHTIDYSDRGGVQTLPRKLRDDHKAKKQVYVTKSNVERVSSSPHSWESQRYSKVNGTTPNSNSMINVSIVNKTTPPSSALGPAKPARTYRTNLLRSKSFNVHAADMGSDFNSIHKSNPQLHRLDESPPPLKSPGIVTSISRSTKDLSQAVDEEDYRPSYHNDHSFPFPKSTGHQNDHSFPKSTGHLNGYSSRTVHDTKKKIFMKNLQDRAPELFRTLHGNDGDENRKMSPEIDDRPGRMFTSTPLKNGNRMEYSSSFRSSNTSSPLANGSDRVHSPTSPTYTTSITHTPSFRNGGEVVNRSVVRRGSNDDYSETVRITSKSDDPIRPSVTNTVQSFSKKTVPVRGGRGKETIESSETKTITKSQYRAGDRYMDSKYAPRNGGVVIEVRNNPK